MQSEIKTKCIIVREGKAPYPLEAMPDQKGSDKVSVERVKQNTLRKLGSLLPEGVRIRLIVIGRSGIITVVVNEAE